MKKYKQILAFLLALCTLVSVAMPTVFATETGAEDPAGENTPGAVVPEPVDYVFYTPEQAGKTFREESPAISAAYQEGTSNWRYEAADTAYQFRLKGEADNKNGGSIFTTTQKSIQYVSAASNSSNTRFFAVRIQSPGAGRFDLTLTHGAGVNGATKSSMYIVDADIVEGILGENAQVYADAMAQDIYLNTSDAYAAYKTAIVEAIKDKTAAMTINFYDESNKVDVTTEGSYFFEADKEYIVILTADAGKKASIAYLYMNMLSAVYSEDQSEEVPEQPEVPEEPEVPEGPGYTEGVYDFYQGVQSGVNLAEGIEAIAAQYAADTLNWKYEALGGGLNLSKVTYNGTAQSMKALSAKNWWLAFRIKAPGEDGAYDIKMTHGAGGDGATAGSIFVIPGDTATEDILKVMTKAGPAMTTDWFYGEVAADTIGGRETTTGSVNLRAGQEYIVVFLPTEKSLLNNNASFYMGQLAVTRTGDIIESDDEGEGGLDYIEYEFYDWDNPGQYLIHYKTEEQLGKKILSEKIAQEYADGARNWCYQPSNGYALFSTGTPYLNITVGEGQYFAIKIKSPGTGTYAITYDYYAVNSATAGVRGSVFILPYAAGMEYAEIKDEANFKDPIINAVYQAEKTTLKQSQGTYTAFREGMEYLICFSVEDNDTSKKSSLAIQPYSMKMTRTGDYQPEAGEEYDDGIVYKLSSKEFAGKAAHSGAAYEAINARYASGTSNWKIESGVGSAKFYNKYLQLGTGAAGKCWAIRIKAPGTGTYKVTLKHMLGYDPNAANVGEMYIIEAPEEKIPGGELNNYLARAPIMEYSCSHYGTRFKRSTETGTYGFLEGKEYLVIFYAADNTDSRNTSTSTYMYMDRLVMKRTGDYVEPPKTMNQGGVAAEDLITEFKIGCSLMTTINGHDYLVFGVYGGTLMIYDLDEWRLVDEIFTGIDTPHGIAQDTDGNWWVTGISQSLYCYNPYTRTGFSTGKFLSGSDVLSLVCGDDGMLYFGCNKTTGVMIYRYDPKTQKYTTWTPESWAKFSGSVKQAGDYIYAAVSGDGHYEMWKMDKYTGKIVDRTDITSRMGSNRYVLGMSFLDDEHLLIITVKEMTVLNTTTMELLTQEEIGLRGKVSRYASGAIDGKQYFISDIDGVCYYDLETKTFGTMGGELANFKTGFRENFLATIEDSRLSETSIITWGGMSAEGLNLYAVNVENNTVVTLIGLVEPTYGYGREAELLTNGLPGSNEIIFSAMFPDAPARVFNTATGEVTREFMTNGQNDSFCWYNDVLYAGNYTGATLTQMDGGKAIALFTLNDENFNQSRIHTVGAGDDKIFVGTIPDNYNHGGVIAWYDLNTELTYVVTGPNPEDVYYANASKVTVTNEWYSAVTNEKVDIQAEWDKDEDGDGICQYFKGPVPLQSIIKVIYQDGLLYGLSCLRGGTGGTDPTGITAQIFVYDVENLKMLSTTDLCDHIDGLPKEIRYIQSLNADPEIPGKFWGVVAETLFSMTYDRATGKTVVKEELCFNKNRVKLTSSTPIDIVFDGDDMYVMFGAVGGLCRVNRNDPSQYEQLLSNFDKVGQIPQSFVLGEDGDIYYITGTPDIYVLNVDVTEEELAEAQAVQDAIDLIPDTITLADRETIFAAREAWDVMNPANQPFVNNYDKLEDAEVVLLQLRIDALSEEITIEDEMELVSIRQTYSTLELEQRMRIDFKKVSDAESIMSILRGERTSHLIAAIGEVALEKEQQIRDARASFMALSRYERTLVQNIETLNIAEAQLNGLLLAKTEAASVDQKIEEIGFVFFSDSKIKIAREAYDALSDTAKEMVTKYDALQKAETTLIVEYVIAVLLIVGGAAVTVIILRKKKVKAE